MDEPLADMEILQPLFTGAVMAIARPDDPFSDVEDELRDLEEAVEEMNNPKDEAP